MLPVMYCDFVNIFLLFLLYILIILDRKNDYNNTGIITV